MIASCPFLLTTPFLAETAASLAAGTGTGTSHFPPGFAGSWLHFGLAAYSVSDVLFYLWFRKTLRAAQKLTRPPVIRLDVHKRVWKCIMASALQGESPFYFLSTWFPIPLAQVGRSDVRNCLAVGFFGAPLVALRPGCEEVVEVDRMLQVVEQQGMRFPAGRRGSRASVCSPDLPSVL
jgi:hypothetical protein